MTSPTPPQAFPPALGWLLAAPAVLGALITLVLPTVQTVLAGFRRGGMLRESVDVGLANHAELLGSSGFWRALGFTLTLTLAPLLVAVVVAPLLALALDRAGTWPRRAGRIVLSLGIVTFSPVGVAVAWRRGLRADSSGVASLAQGLTEAATAPGSLRLIVAAATFGVVCSLAVTAFLPALRAPAGGRVMPGMLAVGALVAIATVAVGLQTFAYGMVLTGGGPERSTETLASLQYHYAFRLAEPGAGAAVATLTGVILGVLGIVATVIAVACRLRITLLPGTAAGPRRTATPPASPSVRAATEGPGAAAVAVGVTALVVVVAVALVCAWPWIDGLLTSPGTEAGGLRTQVNTWVPAVAGALVSVGVAYLAALGIGGLRPLGAMSEWLLLAFAPWLFAGPGVLAVANWQNVRSLGLMDTFAALVPPLLVSVPALLVLTLLCKGLAERAGGDFFGGVFLPSLPMAGILAGAVTLVNAQGLLWPQLVARQPDLFTAPVAQVAHLGAYTAASPDVGAATPAAVVAVALAAVVAAQLLHLDRLVLTADGSRTRTPSA
ncbi:sugar ABC transporter permease [Nonomuraea mesophila]|uniref:Sugar ABC transporter permease n=1 Tax=Nonomuraea mesophila TaxID=2530382 RepID=A0A4R5FXE6_9ACTN|nr:sugar ABC transporter permease [Nonomuraea mesophila]TDE59310.1 sugar ABC transporter permease [Nonomuraea mesophila]